MPTPESNRKYLASFIDSAPILHREMIKAVINGYRSGKIKKFMDAERVVMMLASKNAQVQRSGRAASAYRDLMARSGLLEPPPAATEALKRKLGEKGLKEVLDDKDFQDFLAEQDKSMGKRLKKLSKKVKGGDRLVDVILYCDRELDAERKKKVQGEGIWEAGEGETEEERRNRKKYGGKKWRGLHQFWKGQLRVSGGFDKFWDRVTETLTRKGEPNWKRLYRLCLTDPTFKTREVRAPGYLEGIYVIGHHVPADTADADYDPLQTAKRASEQKMTIEYRYCSNSLDLSKNTFEEALQLKFYTKNECWINSLYDFYHDKLLSLDKKRNLITRQSILDTLGVSEETVKDGLTIETVKKFFQKYKLKLRIYDRFYKLIDKYDPTVPNFHNKPMHVLVDADHVYRRKRPQGGSR